MDYATLVEEWSYVFNTSQKGAVAGIASAMADGATFRELVAFVQDYAERSCLVDTESWDG
jgi:hypothetical protein